jgi:predicted AlkP superfamily pyrophosphatase or phosphodiesterase
MVDKVKMVHTPTVYDAAHKAGLTTAQIDWVAINNAPTITWPFNEWASPAGPVEQEMIRKGVISADDVQDFTKSNILFRDQIWTKAAVHLIREHRPNLMLLHFLSLDSSHHQFGPKTLAANAAMAFLDSCVEKVVAAVHEAGMDDRTTFFVVADHGFKGYTKEIRPAIALAEAGLTGKVHVVPEGGTAMIYVASPDVIPQAVKALEGLEGVGQVIAQDGYAALGLPLPAKDPQMSPLLLTAKAGYSFSGATGGPVTAAVPQLRGSHGYLSSDPEMDALFIASGYGVRKDSLPAKISNLDVAPTLAALLGVPLPSAKGKPLPLQ